MLDVLNRYLLQGDWARRGRFQLVGKLLREWVDQLEAWSGSHSKGSSFTLNFQWGVMPTGTVSYSGDTVKFRVTSQGKIEAKAAGKAFVADPLLGGAAITCLLVNGLVACRNEKLSHPIPIPFSEFKVL